MKHIENSDADTRLWEAIVAHEGEIFVTARGLEWFIFGYSQFFKGMKQNKLVKYGLMS